MPLPKLAWVGIAIALVVVVLVGVVVALGLGGLGLDSGGGGGGGTHTVTETIFPAGFARNYSGISSQSQGYHILTGGTYSGTYTVSSSGALYLYVLTPAQMEVFNSTGSVTTSLWSSLGASSGTIQYSVPATGVYYFLLYHPNGPTCRFTVTSSIQVTLVTVA